jgi:hypothetical protein
VQIGGCTSSPLEEECLLQMMLSFVLKQLFNSKQRRRPFCTADWNDHLFEDIRCCCAAAFEPKHHTQKRSSRSVGGLRKKHPLQTRIINRSCFRSVILHVSAAHCYLQCHALLEIVLPRTNQLLQGRTSMHKLKSGCLRKVLLSLIHSLKSKISYLHLFLFLLWRFPVLLRLFPVLRLSVEP